MKLLLVEDDPSLREGLTELLSELAQVVPTASVEEALGALDRQVFEVVLTDLRLEGTKRGGGRRILAAARAGLMPVVVLSALTVADIEDELAGRAPDAILTKPFQLEDALGVTDRFLRLRGDLEHWIGAQPPDAAFEEVSKGLEVAHVPGSGGRAEVRWFRLGREARAQWTPSAPELSLIVDGTVHIPGGRRTAGHALYAPASEPVRLYSPEGALAVAVTLPADDRR